MYINLVHVNSNNRVVKPIIRIIYNLSPYYGVWIHYLEVGGQLPRTVVFCTKILHTQRSGRLQFLEVYVEFVVYGKTQTKIFSNPSTCLADVTYFIECIT